MRLPFLAGTLVLLLIQGIAQSEDQRSAQSVVSFSPSCPEPISGSGQFQLPVIDFRYDPSAPGAALSSLNALSLRIATVTPSLNAPVQSVPMARQPAGYWSVAFKPQWFGMGYFVFYFEDGDHHIDNNHGAYWDIVSCRYGQPWPYAMVEKSQTWLGHLIAPEVQRPLNIEKAIAILRGDLASYPNHVEDYFSLWTDELVCAGQSAAGFVLVGQEIDQFLAEHGNDYYALLQTVGFVAANQTKLPPTTVERFRHAVTSLPQTAEAFVWRGNRKQPVPRDAAWVARMEKSVHNSFLAELDYWPHQNDTDRRKQAAEFLAYANEYPDALRTGAAYLAAMEDEESLNDVAAVERVEASWSAWDPKNPDPPAVLAHFYLDQKIKLDKAVELLNQAQALYTAAIPKDAEPNSNRLYRDGIKSHIMREVTTTPGYAHRIEFLRGRVYLLLNELPQARADLEVAAKAKPDSPEVEYAVGQVRERMGDLSQALDAYLAAASAPYSSTVEAQAAYERVFVRLKLGSIEAADKRVVARVEQAQKQIAADYVPVQLNQTAPEFSFHALGGRSVDNASEKGHDAIINFWSVWCIACTLELPDLLKFQRLHPKVNVLAVAIDDRPQEVRDYIAAHHLGQLPVAVASEFPPSLASGYPTTLVFDDTGRLQFLHNGFLPDVETILDRDVSILQGAH